MYVCACTCVCMHVRDALWGQSMVSGTHMSSLLLSSVQSLSRVRLFVTPWIAAHQASLSITTSCSLLKLMSIESVMPSNHLILCRPLLLLPPIPPSIRVFSNEAGQRLKEFCQENALVIINTLFQQHKRRVYTWTSPDGQH